MDNIPQAARTGRARLRLGAAEAGLAPDTRILTAEGLIPAAYLEAGDRIVTRRGMRRLRAIARRSLPQAARRVLVPAGALGGKPGRDLLLLPGQRVLLRDWRAQALWGREIAAPPVARLVDGQVLRWVPSGGALVLELYFGAPEVIYAEAVEIASADAIPAPAGAPAAGRG